MAAKQPSPERLLSKVVLGVMLGIVVTALFLIFADLQKVISVIQEMPAHWILLAFLFTLFSYLLRLAKWHLFTRWANFSIAFKDNAVIFFIGLMMSITPGKAGELIKTYLLKKRADIAYSASLPIVIYDRFTDLLAMMALVGIGMLVYPFGLPSLIGMGLLIVAFFVIVQQRSLVRSMIGVLTKPAKLQRLRKPLEDFYEQTLLFMRFRILSFSFLISLVAWGLECVSLFVIVHALGLDVSFVASILTFSLGTIAGALSMIPGGLGAAEGSITGLLVYFGVSGSLAVTISLLIRFVTLWFGVILGVMVFLMNRKKFF